jgi:hypothetical protein
MVSSIGRKVEVSHGGNWLPGTIVDGFEDGHTQGFLYEIDLDRPDRNGTTRVIGRPARIGLRQQNFRFVGKEA